MPSYDRVPYRRYSEWSAHPDVLATTLRLFGMEAASLAGARVLEMGAASGGTLVPMAEAMPKTQFVGIDISELQVQEGNRDIRALGLTNIELRLASIDAIDSSWGDFDYIICHGVYSWVNAALQNQILHTIAARLNPTGAAYVSFNTLPGWNLRRIIRDYLQVNHPQLQQDLDDPTQVRKTLQAWINTLGPELPLQAIKTEAEQLLKGSDAYLVHELLEEDHSALYLTDFAQRLDGHHLAYVADVTRPLVDTTTTVGRERLQVEQLADFQSLRSFRRACIVHARPRRADQPLSPRQEHLQLLRVRTHLVPPRDLKVHQVGEQTFASPIGGGGITVRDPRQKQLLLMLSRAAPGSMPVQGLTHSVLQSLLQRTDVPPEWLAETEPLIEQTLWTAVLAGHVALSSDVDRYTCTVPERPLASAWARLNLPRDTWVTNRRSETVQLSPAARLLLPMMDGSHSVSEIESRLQTALKQGELKDQPNAATDPKRVQELTQMVLTEIASHALLAES